MTTEIEVKRLVNFETAIDGTAVKLIVRDVANRAEAVLGQGRGLTLPE